MTVAELRDRMSADEWVQWAALYSWRAMQAELSGSN